MQQEDSTIYRKLIELGWIDSSGRSLDWKWWYRRWSNKRRAEAQAAGWRWQHY